MSTPNVPGQPSEPADRPAAPPPGWAPAPLSGADHPYQPGSVRPQGEPPRLGGPATPSARIDEFAAPRSIWPAVVGVIAVIAAVAIWASTTARPSLPSATKPSVTPVSTAAAPGLPFVSPDERLSGRWEVLRHEWSDSGVELEVRIAADRGPISYSFVAFENNGVTATDPLPSTNLPRLSGLPVQTGSEETGWLFLPLSRGDATLILANAAGQQMSALPIPG